MRAFLVFLLCLVWAASVSAAEVKADIKDVSGQVLTLLNDVRARPVEYAFNLGLKPDELSSFWGRAYSVLEDGVPSLNYSPLLERMAEEDMERYLSGSNETASLSGVKIHSSAIVVVAFENRISEEMALDILTKSLIYDALEAKPYAAAVLFPIYTDFAAVLGKASVEVGGQDYNVYALVVETGIAEDLPETSYIVGKFSPPTEPPAMLTEEGLEPACVWPGGLFFLRSCGEKTCYMVLRFRVGDRMVKGIYSVRVGKLAVLEDLTSFLNIGGSR